MTFNDGCLGSRNDEERSEMRYVMRIADSVNHQTFERTLRFREMPGAILFECLFSPLSSDRSLWAADAVSASGLKNKRIKPYTYTKDDNTHFLLAVRTEHSKLKPQIKIEDPLN